MAVKPKTTKTTKTGNVEIGPFTIYQDARGEYRWRITGRNNRILADSGEGYRSVSNAERAIGTLWNDLVRIWVEGLASTLDEKLVAELPKVKKTTPKTAKKKTSTRKRS